MQGFIEALTRDQLRGWAFDPLAPDEHARIGVYQGDALIVETIADIPRNDLMSAGLGRGDHGFVLELPADLVGAEPGQVKVIASSRSGRRQLDRLSKGAEKSANQASNALIPAADLTQFPVFVLGPARSGTSALALALLKTRRYEGFGEGHLLPLAAHLLAAANDYYARFAAIQSCETHLRAVPLAAFDNAIRRSFVQAIRYAFPTGRWVDKTPTVEMVEAAPALLSIWPNARFVFLKRRVIENIASRLRKFPNEAFANHYLDWGAVMAAWLGVRGKLAGRSIEIEHLELARAPDLVGAELGAFLEMPAVDIDNFVQLLSTARPEQTAAEFASICSVERLGLSAAQLRDLHEACDDVMASYGYDYTANYYVDPSRHARAAGGGAVAGVLKTPVAPSEPASASPSLTGIAQTAQRALLRSAADAAMARQEWSKAAEQWSLLRANDTNDIAAYVLGSEALWRAGRADEADRLASVAAVRFPDSAWAAHGYADMASRRGDWTAAQARWQAARERFADDPVGYVNGAYALLRGNALAEAEVLLCWVLAREPEHPDATIQMAQIAGRRGDWEKAAKAWRTTRQACPDRVAGYGAGIEALLRLGELAEAELVATQAIARFPDDRWVARLYVEVARQSGRVSVAEERLAAMRAKFPGG